MDGSVTRWMKKGELLSVEEGSGTRTAGVAKEVATLATVVSSVEESERFTTEDVIAELRSRVRFPQVSWDENSEVFVGAKGRGNS